MIGFTKPKTDWLSIQSGRTATSANRVGSGSPLPDTEHKSLTRRRRTASQSARPGAGSVKFGYELGELGLSGPAHTREDYEGLAEEGGDIACDNIRRERDPWRRSNLRPSPLPAEVSRPRFLRPHGAPQHGVMV